MTAFDYVVLAVLGLSVLLSVMRGLVQELMALAAWVLAAGISITYADDAARLMPAGLPSEPLRYLAGFAGLFFAVWLLTTLTRITLNQFVKAAGLKPLDRLAGGVFGLVRGVLFVMLIVLGAGLTSLPKNKAWQDAMFSPLFEASALMVLPWLPQALSQHVRYE
ncbi:CvpA family protein [Chitiniphilus purpureus]|uniref:CvpA family protein n=1 Tax=Chitiniphilus purpureus TaxID=2981137 RepID=A0ABY6DI84_9NEIS|nr:CvpA family protein [Chitiniphilus sp. CD1]UXY13742.1 CvpA family protein [Chitiniphilus sp. CD1]